MKQINLQFHHPQFPDDLINKSLTEILDANTLLSMATIKDGKEPWINTVYYAYNEKLDFCLMTQSTTQHGINLKENTSVAVSIFDSHQNPTDKKRGLQIFGTWELATGLALEEGTNLYGDRFSGFKNYINKVKDWDTTPLKSRIYVIHTKTVKIFDEEIFGPETWLTVKAK